jgi:hypothetical protein
MKKINLFIFLCGLFLLSACGTDWDVKDFTYYNTDIEGMPCLIVQSRTYGGYYVSSVTCDWSKWNGKTIPEELK